MFTASRFVAVALVFGGITAGVCGQGPSPPLPPTPVPVAATYPAPGPQMPAQYPGAPLTSVSAPPPGPYVGPPPDNAPLATPLPPPPPPPPPPPGGAIFVPAEPAPYRAYSVWGGLFFETDLYFLKPTIKGTLNGNQLQTDGSTYTFNTPGADLGATVSPRFEFGWRLPDNGGEFIFSYRFISSEGDAQTGDSFGPLAARTTLDLNVFDFDYGTGRWSPWSHFGVQARLGVRLETVYFKNQATDGQGFFETSNSNFVGAGPHAAVDFDYELPWIPGMAAFAKFDGALAFGQDRQKFSETYADGSFYPFSQSRTDTASNFTVQTGLSYTPSHWRNVRFLLGFQYERFWDVGKGSASNGDVQDIGGFIGGLINF